MKRTFNTTGPCDSRFHYLLPPEERLPQLRSLIEERLYFVLHAARQTGKTTAMRAFAERLRGLGYVAVHATLEASQGLDETADAEPLWLESVQLYAGQQLPLALRPVPPADLEGKPPGSRLQALLSSWAAQVAPARIVLLLDEADVVAGPALISLLRQLRAGFHTRPENFPSSVALIGMRDLRDYLARAKDGRPVSPGSPFNIKSDSLTLRNFTEAEIGTLYGQHTGDTGQQFTPGAVARASWWTDGQPFLVNALARICVRELAPIVEDQPPPEITSAHIDTAKERLILSRTTHLDSLAERLKEPRVAAIVQAVITGDLGIPYDTDDFQYVVDLGLIRRGHGGAETANPIYREILARQIGYNFQENLRRPWWRWATPEGRLDFPALVDAFITWWRENADALTEDLPLYPEAVPHFAFMAFLQRVVNGGGTVLREYAANRGAIDLVVLYGPDRFVVEIKRVRPRDGLERIRTEGITQLSGYLDSLGADEGWLLVFDSREGRSWDQRCWTEEVELEGRTLHLRGG